MRAGFQTAITAVSAFEQNPASAGTPHEAACDAGLLRLALALRSAGRQSWEPYLETARHNLESFYVHVLWDPDLGAFRDGQTLTFVPNKAATASEAFFLLGDLDGDSRWIDRFVLPTLDRILSFQVTDPGPSYGAIAQNSLGYRRIEKYFPVYVARTLPALLEGYRRVDEPRYLEAALRGMQFVFSTVSADGTFPAVLYPGGQSNRYPAWIAPLGDILRAADGLRPDGFAGDLSATEEWLLAGQDSSGGIQTARGFGGMANGRPPELPDVRDLLHVAGWTDKAFRYLAAAATAAAPVDAISDYVFEAPCELHGNRLVMRETPGQLEFSSGGTPRYLWRKGDRWPVCASPEFWLR